MNKSQLLYKNIEFFQDPNYINKLISNQIDETIKANIKGIKTFFKLSKPFEVAILVYFINKKINENGFISINNIIRHFSFSLENSAKLYKTIQVLLKRGIIYANNIDYDNEYVEYALTKNCWEGILSYRKLFLIEKNVTDRSTNQQQVIQITENPTTNKKSFFTTIHPEDILNENYFHQNKELNLVEKMLSNKGYDKIKDIVPRLSILISGKSGVGKTGFVYQLAKKSNRILMTCSCDKILSSLVGQSEKNIVAMMEEANESIKQYNTTPIMFLDEAEQLLRSRQEKIETANSAVYQNLTSLFLLQLDAFKGILICSSNFSFKQTLFDPSLKRRFFSIIELTEPDQLVKKKILKNYFHFLTDKECSVLLDQFSNITPAEIKLLFEKFEISQIFDDPKISKFERLYRIIESEIIARETYQLNPTI